MTSPAPQPQQEYIITEQQITELEACQYMTEMALVRFVAKIRSRIAPPYEGIFFRPECPFHEYLEQYMELPERHRCHKDLSSHDTATRNATLDSVQKILREEAQIDENDQYYLWLEDIECAVESLRGAQMTPAPQPQHPADEFIIKREELERVEAACRNEYGEYIGHVNDEFFDCIYSRPAPSPEEKPCDHCDFQERDEREYNIARQAAAQAREKLFEAIKAEYDPVTESVDWDSIEAAYIRCTEAHK